METGDEQRLLPPGWACIRYVHPQRNTLTRTRVAPLRPVGGAVRPDAEAYRECELTAEQAPKTGLTGHNARIVISQCDGSGLRAGPRGRRSGPSAIRRVPLRANRPHGARRLVKVCAVRRADTGTDPLAIARR
ncbi:hypothetical protein GCM10027199_59090 [Amycolatopsis magusensis]